MQTFNVHPRLLLSVGAVVATYFLASGGKPSEQQLGRMCPAYCAEQENSWECQLKIAKGAQDRIDSAKRLRSILGDLPPEPRGSVAWDTWLAGNMPGPPHPEYPLVGMPGTR